MSRLLTPKLLLHGFEFSVLASLVGFGITLIYGNDFQAFLAGIGRIHWGWLLAGVGLASMDWIGGGLRNWVVARQVHPNPSLKGMILAGGMGAWAGYITPLNSGAGPMTMYTMRRYGVPLPVAVTSTFMSFVATILFFAIAGPLALLFGAGRSLGQRGNVLGLSLYDLFQGSLTIIAGIGVLMGIVIFFPRFVRDLIHRIADWVGRRSRRVADRLERLREGIDDAHAGGGEPPEDHVLLDIGHQLLHLGGGEELRLDAPGVARRQASLELLHPLGRARDLDAAALGEHTQLAVLPNAVQS